MVGTRNCPSRVGIGTSTSGFPLSFSDDFGDKISLWGQSGGSYGFGIQSGQLQIHTIDNQSDIVFGSGSSSNFNETMRIKGNGNIQLGGAAQNATVFSTGYTNYAPPQNTYHAEISNDIGVFQCLMLVGNASKGIGWSDRWVGVWDSLTVAKDMYVGGATWKNFGGTWRALNYGSNYAWAYW